MKVIFRHSYQLILRSIHSCNVNCKSPKNINLENIFELDAKSSIPFRNVKQINDAIEYCLKNTKERDYENYVSTLFMPKKCQLSLISILALNAEVAIVRQKIKRNSGVTGIYQLQFWRDALSVWAGRKNGLFPRQPALICLKEFGNAFDDVDLLLNLVEARQSTLGDRPFKTLQEFEKNLLLVHGSLIRLCANILARQSNGILQPNNFSLTFQDSVEKISKAVGIMTLLRGTLPLLQEGVVLLPEDLMNKYQLNSDIIYNNKNPEALKRLTCDLCEICVGHLNSVRALKNDIETILKPALFVPAFRVDFLSSILIKNKFYLFDKRLQQKHPFTSWKLWWKFKTNSY